MSDPTLEAIDNALRDWDVSDDAMRWTAEAPILDANDPVSAWQQAIRALGGRLVIEVNTDPLRSALQNVCKTAARYQELMAEERAFQAEIRRSAMHSAYRHRQLARRRRK